MRWEGGREEEHRGQEKEYNNHLLIYVQSFLLDAQLQYATQKGTLTDALAKAKSFSCTVCSHKPSAPFPAFVTPQQLVTRTVVTVHKFVPKPRAQHMYRIPIFYFFLFFYFCWVYSILHFLFYFLISSSSTTQSTKISSGANRNSYSREVHFNHNNHDNHRKDHRYRTSE